jgi:hydrogenase nickel incorporation protein HypA/HybF
MHELSVCIALLEQVERVAQERASAEVAQIVIKLGPLSGIEPQLLRRSYPIAAKGTVAENANLRIDTTEVVVDCTQCDCRSVAAPNRLLCGECGDFRTRIVSGDEMILQSVEFSLADARVLDTA